MARTASQLFYFNVSGFIQIAFSLISYTEDMGILT